MRPRTLGTLATLLAALGSAPPSEAVLVRATDIRGEPIVGAKVRLRPPQGEIRQTETGKDGRIEGDVPLGSRILIERPGFAPGYGVAGSSRDQSISLEPLRPWMVQNPGRGLGGLGVGPLFLGEWRDLELEKLSFSVSVNGGPPQSSDIDEDQANRERDFDLTLLAPAFHAAFGLPRLSLGRARLYPGFNGTLGDGSVDFDNLSKADGTGSRFDGKGIFWGVGLDLVAVPSPDCPGFVGFAFDFHRLHVGDLDHRFDPQPGFTILDDDSELTYESHTLSLRGGASLFGDLAAPYAGIRAGWSSLEVDSRNKQVAGQSASLDIRNVFELEPATAVEGFAGVDLRTPSLPLFARGEVGFTDRDIVALVKLMWLFDAAGLCMCWDEE